MTNASDKQDANWVIAERKLLSQPAGAVRRSSSPQPSNPPELMPASGLSAPEVLCASSNCTYKEISQASPPSAACPNVRHMDVTSMMVSS
jgi:hypothetical protein